MRTFTVVVLGIERMVQCMCVFASFIFISIFLFGFRYTKSKNGELAFLFFKNELQRTSFTEGFMNIFYVLGGLCRVVSRRCLQVSGCELGGLLLHLSPSSWRLYPLPTK
jgi:hypothetical protein